MDKVYVLGVDPGRTTGLCLLTAERIDGGHVAVQVHRASQKDTPRLADVLEGVSLDVGWLRCTTGTGTEVVDNIHVAIEDYRVYKGRAKQHIGKRLYTAEAVGAVRGWLERVFPDIMIHVLPAQKKGRWPDARIEAWTKDTPPVEGALCYECVPKPHAWDAMKLALTVAESELP